MKRTQQPHTTGADCVYNRTAFYTSLLSHRYNIAPRIINRWLTTLNIDLQNNHSFLQLDTLISNTPSAQIIYAILTNTPLTQQENK